MLSKKAVSIELRVDFLLGKPGGMQVEGMVQLWTKQTHGLTTNPPHAQPRVDLNFRLIHPPPKTKECPLKKGAIFQIGKIHLNQPTINFQGTFVLFSRGESTTRLASSVCWHLFTPMDEASQPFFRGEKNCPRLWVLGGAIWSDLGDLFPY